MTDYSTDFTPVKDIPGIVESARRKFQSGVTKDTAWRKKQIKAVIQMVTDNQDELVAALKRDLGVNDFWAEGVEIESVKGEGKGILANLSQWVKPRSVGTPLLNLPASSSIIPEPYGVVLSISPWNYPSSLCLTPLMTSIAAGNVTVIKPSEVSANTSALLCRLIPNYVDSQAFEIVQGDVAHASELLKHRYDFIHFTGASTIGKIVYKAAAEHLTPVLLELGGKSPAIITPSADIDTAIRRIAWGKWTMNMGQTCISPDYIITTKEMEGKVIDKLKTVLSDFYGDDHKSCPDISRIISTRHAERIGSMLKDSTITVEIGGNYDPESDAKYVSPTVVRATPESKCMQEEIFGPILPIITFDTIEQSIAYVKAGEKPLALYAFGSNKIATEIVMNTSSGGACINDVVMHVGNPELPFGGVGNSGIGSYHGKYGFETFSHLKAVLNKGGTDPSLRFAPYTSGKIAMLKRIRNLNLDTVKNVIVTMSIAALGYVAHKYDVQSYFL